MDQLRDAARQALEFCEFLWREVLLNDWAEEKREKTEAALRAALEGTEQKAKVMVCGVDCFPNDKHCNGYCTGKVDCPPAALKKADWAHLRVYGYAPGHYMSHCSHCGKVKHNLDKRATCCKTCAQKRYNLEQLELCSCGDRLKVACPGEWEPGRDLGNNPSYAKRVNLPRGCEVCGLGKNGEVTGYVCQRSDCPTRVTCGGTL